jgi:hypothetical protein
MDNRLKQDALIEEALRSEPMAAMPRSITVDVMARIQKDARPALVTWTDFMLSLVIALCIGALIYAAQNIPPILVVKLRIQSILLYQSFLINARWLVPVTFFGLAGLLSLLTIPYLQRQLRSQS